MAEFLVYCVLFGAFCGALALAGGIATLAIRVHARWTRTTII